MRFESGVWEQNHGDGDGFVPRSRHRTLEAAQIAAKKITKRLFANHGTKNGGANTWSGGYREDGGPVTWISPYDLRNGQ